MTTLDVNLKPRSFKIRSSKILGNNTQINKIELVNNDERKNYFKNLSAKALEMSSEKPKPNSYPRAESYQRNLDVGSKKLTYISTNNINSLQSTDNKKITVKNTREEINENIDNKKITLKTPSKFSGGSNYSSNKRLTLKIENVPQEVADNFSRKLNREEMQVINPEEDYFRDFLKKPQDHKYTDPFKSKTIKDGKSLPSLYSSSDQIVNNRDSSSYAVDSNPKAKRTEKKYVKKQLSFMPPDAIESNEGKFANKNDRDERGVIPAEIHSPKGNKNFEDISLVNSSSLNKGNIPNKNIPQLKNSRTIKSIFAKSQAGKDDTGSFKINQDSYMIMNKIFKLENFSIYGVFDGHGAYGHLVSGGINSFLNKFFSKEDNYSNYSGSKSFKRKSIGLTRKDSLVYTKFQSTVNEFKIIKEEFIYEKLKENNYELIKHAFQDAENELINSNFDVSMSGSTCVLVFVIKDKVICANVGDSRAIMIGDESSYKDESKISNFISDY